MIQINTPRLILREMSLTEADIVGDFYRDPRFSRYLTCLPASEAKANLQKLVTDDHSYGETGQIMTLLDKNSEAILGKIHLSALGGTGNLTYGLHPDYWGRGLMQEAVAAMTDFGHTRQHLTRIVASVVINNIASRRILEKIGYQRSDTDSARDGWLPDPEKSFHSYVSRKYTL